MSYRTMYRFTFILIGVVGFWFAYYDFAYADVASPFDSGGGNPEAKLKGVFSAIIDFILYLAMGLSGIAIAWGVTEYNGLIGDKKEGVEKIKRGAIVLACAGIVKIVITKLSALSV